MNPQWEEVAKQVEDELYREKAKNLLLITSIKQALDSLGNILVVTFGQIKAAHDILSEALKEEASYDKPEKKNKEKGTK